jgi:hypothetical protein
MLPLVPAGQGKVLVTIVSEKLLTWLNFSGSFRGAQASPLHHWINSGFEDYKLQVGP